MKANQRKECHPLFVEGNRGVAVLIIHGFTGTPYEMYPVAESLIAEGFTVSLPLLPGHGLEDASVFAHSRYRHWREAVFKEFEELRLNYQKVFVVGLSMGGTLSLDIAENLDPAGVVAIAPALFINSTSRGIFTDIRLFALPLLQHIIKKVGEEPELKAPEEGSKEPTYAYRGGIYLKPLASLMKGMRRVRKNLGLISSPVMFIHAVGDKVVPYQNSIYGFNRVSSNIKELHLINLTWQEGTSRHVITRNEATQKRVTSLTLDFIKSNI